uniref:NAD(P)/FAD-dependent oxidoreductase n=1 Tax=Paractinoplanes polyasparticus TaxID=2856853 RepID=UPI001C844E00|nr:hypothetical protein [Actinoplanes polyasparticus]
MRSPTVSPGEARSGAGAPTGDAANDIRWYLDGRPILAHVSGLPAVMASRALVEHVVRQRVAATINVKIVDATEVTGLRVTGDGSRVIGVSLAGPDRTVDADLVVDAGGRGSRSPVWLADLGLPEVPRETVELGLSSVSRGRSSGSSTWSTRVPRRPPRRSPPGCTTLPAHQPERPASTFRRRCVGARLME